MAVSGAKRTFAEKLYQPNAGIIRSVCQVPKRSDSAWQYCDHARDVLTIDQRAGGFDLHRHIRQHECSPWNSAIALPNCRLSLAYAI
jgi:hypothetical protein